MIYEYGVFSHTHIYIYICEIHMASSNSSESEVGKLLIAIGRVMGRTPEQMAPLIHK